MQQVIALTSNAVQNCFFCYTHRLSLSFTGHTHQQNLPLSSSPPLISLSLPFFAPISIGLILPHDPLNHNYPFLKSSHKLQIQFWKILPQASNFCITQVKSTLRKGLRGPICRRVLFRTLDLQSVPIWALSP